MPARPKVIRDGIVSRKESLRGARRHEHERCFQWELDTEAHQDGAVRAVDIAPEVFHERT
jgi:hypothetical protein